MSTKKTYKQAQNDLMAALLKAGWAVNSGLKTPHATSPDGLFRLWFKAQAIYFSKTGPRGSHVFGDARSLHLGDIRTESVAELLRVVEFEHKDDYRPGWQD